jgi:hypothetical protein
MFNTPFHFLRRLAKTPRWLTIGFAFSLLGLWTLEGEKPKKAEWLGPYVATPLDVVQEMLKLGELKSGEVHYDLGSGDGRIVIMAAQQFRARTIGFEIDPKLVAQSQARIHELGLDSLAHIEGHDLMTADFSQADLVTVYLLPIATEKLTPLLEKQMRAGSRVVARQFAFSDWTPDKVIRFESHAGEPVPLNTLYLYRR